MPASAIADRFFAKVNAEGPCWEWTAATMKQNGYGVFNRGRSDGTVLAHRFSYELLVGPIPDGLQLDHLCRNRICVNPDHLEPVTQRENLLRGTTLPGQNARKDRCPQGHPYDRVYMGRGKPVRVCGTCRRPASDSRVVPIAALNNDTAKESA